MRRMDGGASRNIGLATVLLLLFELEREKSELDGGDRKWEGQQQMTRPTRYVWGSTRHVTTLAIASRNGRRLLFFKIESQLQRATDKTAFTADMNFQSLSQCPAITGPGDARLLIAVSRSQSAVFLSSHFDMSTLRTYHGDTMATMSDHHSQLQQVHRVIRKRR